MADLSHELRRQGAESGLAAVGIAPAAPMEAARRTLEERRAAGLSGGMQFTYRNPARSTDPQRILRGASALVVGAFPYGSPVAKRANGDGGWRPKVDPNDDAGGRPKGAVARYARRDHYATLRSALATLASTLERSGWQARVVADDNALVDRAAAYLAGIGWFGKNSNILLPGLGSWFLLGSVVTDAPLLPDTPAANGCGACRRCISSCPTGALVAPGVLDARRCLAWLLQAPGVFPFEYREALGGRVYGCDDCQDVCPVNVVAARAANTALGDGQPTEGQDRARARAGAGAGTATDAGDEGEVDLLAMLDTGTSDADLLARYGRWYIPKRDPRYLRRNALLALANVADGSARAVVETVSRYLRDPDEMLRAHAVWAAARLGRRDLIQQAALADDPSALVQDELRCLPGAPTSK